jgi:hypothetical protein
MHGLIKPATVKVVANPFDHGEAKIKLGWFAKGATQAPIVCRRLIAYGSHNWHQLAPQL